MTELTPFPLLGVRASHLEKLVEDCESGFVKISVSLIGKAHADVKPRSKEKIIEKLNEFIPALLHCPNSTIAKIWVDEEPTTGASSPRPLRRKSTPQATHATNATAEPEVRVRVVIKLANSDEREKVREILGTAVQRQQVGTKLGEDSELVPFIGFSSLEISPEESLTTRDFCDVYIAHPDKPSKASYLSSNADVSGPAGTYVIHSWSAPFRSIWDSLSFDLSKRGDASLDSSYYWIDLLSLPQQNHAPLTANWLTTVFCDAIGSMGSSVMVLHNWQDPLPLKRSWCVWEILATIQQGTELSVVMPADQRASFDEQVFMDLPGLVKTSFDRITTDKLNATRRDDQDQISASIRNSIGFEGANLVIKERLLIWLSTVCEAQVRDPSKVRDHLATATFCLRLAKIMSATQGRHAEAELLLKKALDTRTVELGNKHELTMECSVALANVYRLLGKVSEAEVMIRRVYDIYSDEKGPEHDETLLAAATLCRVLVDRGYFPEAEKVCLMLKDAYLQKHGVQDRRTMEALITLSQLADYKSDSDAAAGYLRLALTGFEAVFGTDAAQTWNLRVDLAGFLVELENFDEAEELLTQATSRLNTLLSAHHDWTVKAVTSLNVLRQLKSELPTGYTPGQYASPAAKTPEAPRTGQLKTITSGETLVSSASRAPDESKSSSGNAAAPSLEPTPSAVLRVEAAAAKEELEAEIMSQFSSAPREVSAPSVSIGVQAESMTPKKAPEPTSHAEDMRKVYASERLMSLRESRLENLGHAATKPTTTKGRREHHGWLEKLPLEMSQREKERIMLREAKAAAASTGAGGSPAPQSLSASKSNKSSLLTKLASRVGISSKRLSFTGPATTSSVFGDQDGVTNAPVAQLAAVQKNWQRRYFVLNSNARASSLVYWIEEALAKAGKNQRGNFIFDDADSRIFETSPLGPLCFSVTGPKGRLHLRAQSAADKAKWIEHIKIALAFRGAGEKSRMFEEGAGEAVAMASQGKDMWGPNVALDDLMREHSKLLTEEVSQAQSIAQTEEQQQQQQE